MKPYKPGRNRDQSVESSSRIARRFIQFHERGPFLVIISIGPAKTRNNRLSLPGTSRPHDRREQWKRSRGKYRFYIETEEILIFFSLLSLSLFSLCSVPVEREENSIRISTSTNRERDLVKRTKREREREREGEGKGEKES